MSIENKTKNISFRLIFTLFGIGAAGIAGLRIYQMFFLSEDDKSGFFARINPSVYALYFGAAVMAVLIILLVSFSNKVTASKSFRGENKQLAAGGILMAIGMGWDVTVCTIEFIKSVASYTASSGLIGYLFSNAQIAVLFEAVCGLFGCIYFVLYGLSYLDGKTTFYEYRFLALTPVFWVIARVVKRFMTKISFIVVADLMLELAMLVFAMLFMLSFARICAQICQKREMRRAMKYGLVSAMFAFAISVSRLVAFAAGRSGAVAKGFPFNLADLAYCAFAVLFVANSLKTGRGAEEDELIVDEDDSSDGDEIDVDFLNE
ncbi:MAG: hypothetical protein E7514_04580 [Ruminococcaceae bacterium]|nr:hypothetical protein [Oscillospiraceae bacterium]